jgi:hypothetical protein
MLIPQYAIIAVMLSVAFVPGFYMQIIGNSLTGLMPGNTGTAVLSGVSGTISGISMYSLLLTAIAGFIWIVRSRVMKTRVQRVDATWGCGYTAPDSRQQYTGKSFSKPLGKIFNFLLIERKHYTEIEKGEIFPSARSYVSHYYDFFEHNFIQPFTRRLNWSVNYFSFIQNGRIQSYVLYGIVFILAMFILTVFNVVS